MEGDPRARSALLLWASLFCGPVPGARSPTWWARTAAPCLGMRWASAPRAARPRLIQPEATFGTGDAAAQLAIAVLALPDTPRTSSFGGSGTVRRESRWSSNATAGVSRNRASTGGLAPLLARESGRLVAPLRLAAGGRLHSRVRAILLRVPAGPREQSAVRLLLATDLASTTSPGPSVVRSDQHSWRESICGTTTTQWMGRAHEL